MSSPTPQGSRTPSEASAAIGGSPTSAEGSAGGVASSAGLPAPAGSSQSSVGLSMPTSAAADARGASSGSAGAPAGASEDSRPSAASRSTSTSAFASASGASSSLVTKDVRPANRRQTPVGRAARLGTLRRLTREVVTKDVRPANRSLTGPSKRAQSGSRSEGSSSAAPVPALPPMHAVIPMPFPRYIRLEELSSVVNEASKTTVREGTRAVADNLDVSFESLARLIVHLARAPPLRFNPDLDERLERAEGLQAVVNAVVPLADAPPGRDEELAALVDGCEDLRFRLADAEAALAREVADRQRVKYLCTQASGERNAAQDELRRVRGELLAANRELGPTRSALDNSTQMVANLRSQLQDKDRALNAVYLQHRVDKSDYRVAVAKYSAEVAQLNRLLQSSATPVSPSAQPAGASHGSLRSASSRLTNPGNRPLSKSSAAGLSLAAAGLGSSSSDSEDSGPRKPSAKRHRLSQGKPSHPLGSPSGPSAGKSQLPASKRLGRPSVDLRAKAGSSKASSPSPPGPEASAASPAAAFCSRSLLPGSQSPASASHASLALTQQSSAPSGAVAPSPPGPRAASPAAPEVVDLSGDDQVDEAFTSVNTSHEISLSTPKRRDGRPTREASVTASLRSKASLEALLASDDLVLGPQMVVSSVSSPAQASAAPSSPPPLPPASIPAPTDVSAGVLSGSLGSGSASSAPPRHGRSLPYQITATLSTTPGTSPNAFTPVTSPPPPPASRAPTLRRKLPATATKFLTPAFVGNGAQMAWRQIHNARVPDPLPTDVKIPCSVAGIRAYANYEDPNHPWQRLRRKMPDRPCTFDPGNNPLRPISLRPQGLSRVTKVWRQLQGNPAGRSESSDLGFASWERGHLIPIGAIEHLLDAFAQEVGEDSAEFQAILAAWIEFDRARNLRADRYRQQVPHRYWDWAIRPSSDPTHIFPELMLEPTILTFSFEVIPWIPKTADWVSEVSVVDDRQPWRNCWIDVPGQHPFNTTFAPCNPPLSAQEIISPWAVELLNRRTQPETPPPASLAAPVDDESQGDLQSSVAAAAALVGAASSTGDVSEASFTDTPAGSNRPRPDLSDLADAATAASL
ncbi:unnamed protein product [Phytophthora lilii]|uniref:Unnamed protein product n=1 Tax=Phytophthora lilii TaxID=2077276 RepID=A0A9W6TM96_9STRA|nr:unnamed protein product [Phytophthora lilii]